MNISTIQAPRLVQFGPLLITAALFIALLKTTTILWQLPLAAIVGLTLCYKWQWRGVLASIVLLGAIAGQYFWENGTHDWMWVLTLTLSFAAALVVTGLTFEESCHAWDILQKEVEDGKRNLLHITESVESSQQSYEAERNDLISRVEFLQKELAAREKKLSTTESLVGIVRDELTVMHAGQEKLLQELHEARQHVATQVPLSSDDSQPDNILEIATLKSHQETMLMELSLATQQLAAYEEEIAALTHHTKLIEEESSLLKNEQSRMKVIFESLNSEKWLLNNEKQLLESTIARLHADLESANQNNAQQLDTLHTIENSFKEMKCAAEDHQNNTKALNAHIDILEAERQNLNTRGLDLEIQCELGRAELAAIREKYHQLLIEIERLRAEKECVNPAGSEPKSQEARRFEGLYKQLCEQFEQKNIVLDNTRRELFFTQEKLIALYRDIEEATLTEGRENESLYQGILSVAERELNEMQSAYESEIASLNEIICKLSDP